MIHFLFLKRRKLIVNVTSIYYNIKKLYLIIFKDLFLTWKFGEIVLIWLLYSKGFLLVNPICSKYMEAVKSRNQIGGLGPKP